VLIDWQGTLPRIWTVIDAKPSDRTARDSVYEAQLATLVAHPEIEVDFRLINASEFADSPVDQILPVTGRSLWIRTEAA
jgi:hypothetical protein